MHCKDVQRRISAYLDDELSPSTRDAVFDHLEVCEACCDAMGEYAFTEAMVATTLKRPMDAPASIRMNVLSAISREAQAPVRGGIWQRLSLRPAAGFAALLALAGAGWRTFTSTLPAPQITVSEPMKTPARVAMEPPVRIKSPAPRTVKPAMPQTTVQPAPKHKVAPDAKPDVVRREKAFTPKPVAPKASVTPAPSQPAPKPAAAPVLPAFDETLAAVGQVTQVTGTLLQWDERGEWQDFSTEHSVVKARLRSAEDTVAALQLRDGTLIKSNISTEFQVLRAPSRDEPRWVVRLIRGEILIKTGSGIRVEAPGLDAECDEGEFSVRSTDGVDTTLMVTRGTTTARNNGGAAVVEMNQATVSVAGAAPRLPFDVADPYSQLGWAFVPVAPFNPLDSGGTQS